MSDIIKDKYELSYSEYINIKNVEEQIVDLTLETSTDGDSSVIGHITDDNGDPMSGVTVKLFDNNGLPYKHTITEPNGDYVFADLQSGNYSISAVKTGVIITVPNNFYLQESETRTINFNLSEEPTLSLCSIAGHIMNSEHTVLSGAIVSLIDSTTEQTVYSTISAEDGEYVFYDVVAKQYKIVATKEGFSPSDTTGVLAVNNTVVNIDITLTINPVKNVGTISGYVKNNNVAVSGAFVGLYSVTSEEEEEETETLIATTKTNASGLYMFGDVVTGKYKIKAKQNN